ncbi:MAG: HAD-IC family P-type ATPase [bacterium]|nr:HAD-IC family P-type ATPase [bacterium]
MATTVNARSERAAPPEWHRLPASDVARRLGADPANGLSPAEAARRREESGPNEIEARPGRGPLLRFLAEFHQPLIYILLVAGTVALLLGDWVDAGVILGVTILNAAIGFIQESKAESAIAALARSVSTEATVIRGGETTRVDSRDLVPGDLVLLASGDKVPADLRLAAVRDLQVSEAALTGESVPVRKTADPLDADIALADRADMAYAGSLVTFGRGRGLVVAIGRETETGRISRLIEEGVSLETPLTRKIARFSTILLYVIMGLAAFTFAAALLQGSDWAEGFKAAVALAVSAIPEGLPAVVTVTLAIGVGRMARRHAIIRKLPAVETLGSTTVICSDKTGTLTENQMTVQAIRAGGISYAVGGTGYGSDGSITRDGEAVRADDEPALLACLRAGLLCNDSRLEEKEGRTAVTGDPTEGALIVSARKAGLTREALERELPRMDALPFESEFQYMATLHGDGGENAIFVKGSVEAVAGRCREEIDAEGRPRPLDRGAAEGAAEEMAARGLRVLAFAMKTVPADRRTIERGDVEEGLLLLGLQGMIDPPRDEAIEAVRACRSAGIRVKMITGDHALTARAVARRMGLIEGEEEPVHTGEELAKMADGELAKAAAAAVFARVAPEHKLRLVEALQAGGEVVAMTGDGVNDAPALKQADIGVAMGIAGTEVAKEAADMVLTDDNFASIEAAVEEGRTVYRNLLKTIGFILPVNGGEAMTILMGILVAAAIPILPVQILWVNMVSSVALSATLAFEPKSRRVMERPPRRPGEPLLSGPMLWRILAVSVFNLIAAFGMFEWALHAGGGIDLARTMAVQTLVAAETFYLLTISRFIPSLAAFARSRARPVAWVPAVGVGCVVVFQVLFSQAPLMNLLFHTERLTPLQGLACLLAGLPVVVPALLLNRYAPIE